MIPPEDATPLESWYDLSQQQQKEGEEVKYGYVDSKGAIYFSKEKQGTKLTTFFKSIATLLRKRTEDSPKEHQSMENLREKCRAMYANAKQNSSIFKIVPLFLAKRQLKLLEKQISAYEEDVCKKDISSILKGVNLNLIEASKEDLTQAARISDNLEELRCLYNDNPAMQDGIEKDWEVIKQSDPLYAYASNTIQDLIEALADESQNKIAIINNSSNVVSKILNRYKNILKGIASCESMRQFGDTPLLNILSKILEGTRPYHKALIKQDDSFDKLLEAAVSENFANSINNQKELLYDIYINGCIEKYSSKEDLNLSVDFKIAQCLAKKQENACNFFLELYDTIAPENEGLFVHILSKNTIATNTLSLFTQANFTKYSLLVTSHTATQEQQKLYTIMRAFLWASKPKLDTPHFSEATKSLKPRCTIEEVYNAINSYLITTYNPSKSVDKQENFSEFIKQISLKDAKNFCGLLFPDSSEGGYSSDIRKIMLKYHPDKLPNMTNIHQDMTNIHQDIFQLLSKMSAVLSGKET